MLVGNTKKKKAKERRCSECGLGKVSLFDECECCVCGHTHAKAGRTPISLFLTCN